MITYNYTVAHNYKRQARENTCQVIVCIFFNFLYYVIVVAEVASFVCVLPSWPYIPLLDPKITKHPYYPKIKLSLQPLPTKQNPTILPNKLTVLVITPLCNAWCLPTSQPVLPLYFQFTSFSKNFVFIFCIPSQDLVQFYTSNKKRRFSFIFIFNLYTFFQEIYLYTFILILSIKVTETELYNINLKIFLNKKKS